MKASLPLIAALSLFLTLLAGGHAFAAEPTQRIFTDMVGRNVTVPQHIRKVYCMGPPCTIVLYTLAPDLMVGWNARPVPGELELLVEPYRNLPVLGGWYGRNNTGNLEEIIKAHPDVIISQGDPLDISTALRVQEQTHIPVLVTVWNLKKLDQVYLLMGKLLGREAQAAKLADYCRKSLDEIESKVKNIPLEKRRKVYYAEGPTGLETDPRGSAHSEAIDFAGGLNVASVPSEGGMGQTPVSMEQVISWDPEIVITGYDHNMSPGEFYRNVWQNPVWQNVRAVKTRDVYEAPQFPFNWIDRPPSVNRIIGIKWLANLFYPNVFHYDIRTETRNFYLLFYHRKLTETELNKLLGQAVKHSN